MTLTAGADTGVMSGKCYRYRVRSSDLVGNEATSAASASVQVDTAAPSVTLDDPGANLAGTVTLSATATDPASGIASVPSSARPPTPGRGRRSQARGTRQASPMGPTTCARSYRRSRERDGLRGGRGPARRQRQPRHDARRDPGRSRQRRDADLRLQRPTGSTFQCRFDRDAGSPRASPLTAGAPPDGARTFEARAADAAANLDPTPASHAWVLDTRAVRRLDHRRRRLGYGRLRRDRGRQRHRRRRHGRRRRLRGRRARGSDAHDRHLRLVRRSLAALSRPPTRASPAAPATATASASAITPATGSRTRRGAA